MLESKFLEQLIAEKKAEITNNPNIKDLNLIRALAFELKHQYGQAESIYRRYPDDELAAKRSSLLWEKFSSQISFGRMGRDNSINHAGFLERVQALRPPIKPNEIQQILHDEPFVPQYSAQNRVEPFTDETRLAPPSIRTQRANPSLKLDSQTPVRARAPLTTKSSSEAKKVSFVDNNELTLSSHPLDFFDGTQPHSGPSQTLVEKGKHKPRVLSEETYKKFRVGQRSILN